MRDSRLPAPPSAHPPRPLSAGLSASGKSTVACTMEHILRCVCVLWVVGGLYCK